MGRRSRSLFSALRRRSATRASAPDGPGGSRSRALPPQTPRMLEAPSLDRKIILAAAILISVVFAKTARAQDATRSLGYVDRPASVQTALAPGPAPAAVFAPAPSAPVPDGAGAAPKEERGLAFDLALAADVPLMFGGQATLEVPYRILFQAELGVLPGFCLDAVDSILTGTGAYDASTSALVRSTLRDSFVMRLSTGFRPFADWGFEILGGYTLASLGGDVSARSAVEAISGTAIPAEIPDASIVIHSTVHAIHFGVGWRWVVADHFVVRATVQYLQALGSASHIDVPAELASNPTVSANVATVNATIDSRLDEIYTSYVKLPIAGLSLGYRF